ncbi:hypothetical protein I316_02459 [Kwoniella heveanensis BCC8398]|uniref:Uncharacterized protein n=1 Tax=Kwoniella heveanensis BCC8398 TaxID=1296120 RepID=A0A1B9GY35_9TREE|nr:hypothetical protein I316_02459 [Kwoniella heveanensis BCC8398]
MSTQTCSQPPTSRRRWSSSRNWPGATSSSLSDVHLLNVTLQFESAHTERQSQLSISKELDTLAKEDWLAINAYEFRRTLETDLSEFVQGPRHVDRMVRNFSKMLNGYYDRNISRVTAANGSQQAPAEKEKIPKRPVDGSWTVNPAPSTAFHVDVDGTRTTSPSETDVDSDVDEVVYNPRSRRGSIQPNPTPLSGPSGPTGLHGSNTGRKRVTTYRMPLKIYDDLTSRGAFTLQDVIVPARLNTLPADEWVSEVTDKVSQHFRDEYAPILCNERTRGPGNSLQDYVDNLRSQVIKHRLAHIGVKTYYRSDAPRHDQRTYTDNPYTQITLAPKGVPTEDEWMEIFTQGIVEGVQKHYPNLDERGKQRILNNSVEDALSMYRRLYSTRHSVDRIDSSHTDTRRRIATFGRK